MVRQSTLEVMVTVTSQIMVMGVAGTPTYIIGAVPGITGLMLRLERQTKVAEVVGLLLKSLITGVATNRGKLAVLG